MSLTSLWRRLRHRARFERDLDDELAFHLEARREHLIRQGHDEAEATRRARIELGMVESHKDAVRAAHGLAWFDQWAGELRRAARSLIRSPLFALSAIAILGAAIAVNLVLFSIYGSYILRTPEIVQRGELVDLADLRGADGYFRPRLSADELRSLAPALAERSRGLLISNMVRSHFRFRNFSLKSGKRKTQWLQNLFRKKINCPCSNLALAVTQMCAPCFLIQLLLFKPRI